MRNVVGPRSSFFFVVVSLCRLLLKGDISHTFSPTKEIQEDRRYGWKKFRFRNRQPVSLTLTLLALFLAVERIVLHESTGFETSEKKAHTFSQILSLI